MPNEWYCIESDNQFFSVEVHLLFPTTLEHCGYVTYKCVISLTKYEHIVNIYLAIYEAVSSMNAHTLLEKFSGRLKSHWNPGPLVYSSESYEGCEGATRFVERYLKETGH